MKQVIFCIFMLAIGACRSEIARRVDGPTTVKNTTTTCYHFAFCYTCLGRGGCGFKASAFCLGHQSAVEHSTPYIVQYDDGSSERITERNYSDLGDCH